MGFLVAQFLSGLAHASSLFLVAAGLSIIFGVTRIVNFAHGSFYMLGAFVAYSLADRLSGALGFWGAVAGAAVFAGLLGVAVEVLLLRRLYRSPELFQLLATFGLVLVVQDLALAIWGPEDLLGPRAPGLEGIVRILGRPFPQYDLLLIALGPAVLGLLWLLFHRTRWGILVRAATEDREMTGALGVKQTRLFTSVLFLGTALAGLAGALQVPREAANLQMDINIVVEAFVVVVIGGMGSVAGAFLASLLIGQLQAFGILIFPQVTLVLVFLVMALVLVVRPYGLLGRPQAVPRAGHAPETPIAPASQGARIAWAAALAVLLALPLAVGDYALVVLTEVFVLALFASSLHFAMGPGGMVSFGHAAYFGLGAYGAGLLMKHLGAGMVPGLIAAPLAAGLGALVFGWFCVRLSGVYLAMLTLAFAQIVWSVAFQWYSVTGGDNGILGVWPAAWAAPKWAFYYLSLVLAGGGIYLLRRVIFSPFGYALRAGRDSPLRSDAIGIPVKRHQWAAFTLSGAAAGLAGGLYAYSKGSVFPNLISISTSVDALVMVLLGGVQTLTGPIVGAAVFHGLETEMVRHTDYWRLLLGVAIIAMVLVFPQGVVGALERLRPRRPGQAREEAVAR
ncbi:ABC transporter permease [Arenibaculum pallidiluteum]|uniref:ABC transporter permease n=1 Tax=Arenibaculum pallidiluteum TaxID=2812559 RepID=UPI001A977FC2|nr:ABC transporter permease [Arenibaculum pallidiluteum]